MKGIVILLLISYTKAALLHPKLYPRNEELPDCSEVANDDLVYFPHPKDCSKFYQCAFQKPVEMSCPEGLEWSVQENRCEYPELANCKLAILKLRNENLPDCSKVPNDALVYFPHPKDCSKFYQCAFHRPVEISCPEGLHWSVEINRCEYPELANCKLTKKVDNRCQNVSDWQNVMFENSKNCGTYYQCVHRKPVLRNCPKGLHFSQKLQRCEYPSIAGCKQNSTGSMCSWPRETGCQSDNPCEEVPDWKNVLLKNPEDCGTFIQCVHQKPMIRNCPKGLHWSVERNRCEYPKIANCIEDIPSK